jgi:hypothetical protein
MAVIGTLLALFGLEIYSTPCGVTGNGSGSCVLWNTSIPYHTGSLSIALSGAALAVVGILIVRLIQRTKGTPIKNEPLARYVMNANRDQNE